MKRAALLLALAACAACDSDFDPPSRVVDLRLLAVRADSPYAAPGASVHLDALAVDPDGRTLTYAWARCAGAGAGVAGCAAQIDPSSFTTTTRPAFDFVVPSDALAAVPAEARGAASVGVVVAVCPGDLAGPAPWTCRASGTGNAIEPALGVKRIFVRESGANANPVLAGITWDGADWPEPETRDAAGCDSGGNRFDACDAALAHRVSAVVDSASFEASETLIVQYYATEGIFEHDVRLAADPATGWVARKAAAGRVVTLFAVVRDDRGGVVWTTRRIRVAP